MRPGDQDRHDDRTKTTRWGEVGPRERRASERHSDERHADERHADERHADERHAEERRAEEPRADERRAEPGSQPRGRSWGARSGRAVALGLAAASMGAAVLGALARPRPVATPEPERPEPPEPASSVDPAASRTSWDLPAVKNDRVDFFIDFLTGRNRDKTRQWLERIGRYAPMIREKLAERGMPEDLLYLAMIESGLDPNAYSSADAAGMWQFIAPTAQRYGLEVSDYVDQRRDPIAATDAALDYLADLRDRFGGDWYLAAAGYNTGEHGVEGILGDDSRSVAGAESLFWKIMPDLPRETRDYVPVMLAMGYIAKEPAKYGFTGVTPEPRLSFDEVRVPGATKLSAVASAAGVDASAVDDLNPQLVRRTTPPGRDWLVRVPVGSRERVAAAFAPDRAGPSYAD